MVSTTHYPHNHYNTQTHYSSGIKKYHSRSLHRAGQSFELIFACGREYFRPYKQLKINFMTSSIYLKRHKLIARLLVDMLYEGRNSIRNLTWIYHNYARDILGVRFDTFSSYLDRGNDPFDDTELPPHIVAGLWELVKVPRDTVRLPEDLQRRITRMRYVKIGYDRKPSLMQEFGRGSESVQPDRTAVEQL